MAEIQYIMHPLPSVFLMELDVPEGFVTQLNEYLDGLLEQEGRRTAADTLVGQIREGEQLRMDCDDKLVAGFSSFVRLMGVEYINAFMKSSGQLLDGNRNVEIDDLCQCIAMQEITIPYTIMAPRRLWVLAARLGRKYHHR